MKNYYYAEDEYGCFEGLYFEVEDNIVALAEDQSPTGYTEVEINNWLKRVEKFVEETA